jgi:hypothetical protein
MNRKNFRAMGEEAMRNTNWTAALILTAMALAVCELSYAHLQWEGLWPLWVVSVSAWRMMPVQSAGYVLRGALWLAPSALILAGILLWIEESRGRRKGRAGIVKGESHE